MAREVVEIRRVLGVMAGNLIRLKDYVTAQLDLRAPFAFLPFNQITQTRPDSHPPLLHAAQVSRGGGGCMHGVNMLQTKVGITSTNNSGSPPRRGGQAERQAEGDRSTPRHDTLSNSG